MDEVVKQLIPIFLKIRNNLQKNCFEARCSHEGEISLITKELVAMRKTNDPRIGVQLCNQPDCVTFHTHLNARRGWTPPCHGDFLCAGIRAALDSSQHLDFILAREGIYVIDASELGKVLREDAKRIVLNPEWKISQQNVKSWTEQSEIDSATDKILRSWTYTWPILSGGEQFEWYRKRGFAFWGPGALSRSIHKPLTRIIEQVEMTRGEAFAELWKEYVEICRGIGIRISSFPNEMDMNSI